MTQEQKLLVYKDLCGRLPYKVICHFEYEDYDKEFGFSMKEDDGELLRLGLENSDTVLGDKYLPIEIDWWESEVRPYLRPLSSMTEKEEKEYSKYAHFGNTLGDWTKSIDYLNSHHFDFRNLIPMGLALPATEGMYNI